jgi:GxxExxY protein
MNAEERRGNGFGHVEITRQIIGVCFEVYRELGFGFLESVYRTAMTLALRDAGLRVESEVVLHAHFRGHTIGTFRVDMLVEGAVLVELKAARAIDSTHVAQLLNYLRCTVLETGLILNFGPTPKIRRLVFANYRKHPHLYQLTSL